MSPLQRIAMGMVIVALPANFPAHPHPAWRVYDALPDPIGWLLVLWGVWALGRSTGRSIDVDWARWAGLLAFVVSVPLWLPQVNHHLAPAYNPDLQPSITWAVSLPPFLFGLALSRAIGQAAIGQEPRDTFVAGRFGVLTWAFGLCIVLPLVGYNLPLDEQGLNGTLVTAFIVIGLVQLAFAYYLFRVHRRTYLGGPGPLEIHPTKPNAAPGGPERRS